LQGKEDIDVPFGSSTIFNIAMENGPFVDDSC
jgi:hypothetical protein